MRPAVVLLSLAACGRLDFGAHPADSPPLAPIDTSVANVYPMAVLEDHPLAYYRLDEATAATAAVDVSGHGNHAAYDIDFGGTGSFTVTGAILADSDPAVRLDAGGNYGSGGVANVVLPGTVFPWAGEFTIEGWIQPLAAPPQNASASFFVWEHYLHDGFRTGWSEALAPQLWTSESGRDSFVDGTIPLALGAWNHLVFTKRGTSVSIYVDGALSIEATIDYAVPDNDNADDENCFGACHGMPSDGVFDELAIYDYALPAARIVAHYNIATGRASL